MSYHLKYLKYKKKYLNLKAELEGGSGVGEVAECLFNQEMTEDNFMDILGDIAECNDEQILQDNRLDRENDYENLEKKIEKYFNFIKERQYRDVPEHARPHLELIADKLPRQYISMASLSSGISAVIGDPEATYKNIIKTRIDFLKSYGKLAAIEGIIVELHESQNKSQAQEATIEQLTRDLQIQEDSFQRQQISSQEQIDQLQQQHQKNINEIQRDTAKRIEQLKQDKDDLDRQLTDEIRLAEEETRKAKQETIKIERIKEIYKGKNYEKTILIKELEKKIEELEKTKEELEKTKEEDIERLNEKYDKDIALLKEQIRKQEEEKEKFMRQLELDRFEIESRNKKIDELLRAKFQLENFLTSMDKTITSEEFINMQLQSEKEKLEQDKLKLEISRLEIKDDNNKLQDSIIALQESNKKFEKELLESQKSNKDLNIVIQKLDKKIVKMGKEKTKEIAKLAIEYVIAKKKSQREFDDLFENLEKEKNKEINDLKDQIISKDNTILKIRTKVNKNLSKLIQNMIDTIEPKTYKQPPLFMI